MSDSDSESKHSSSTTPDPEAPEDPEGPKKNYSDPKHLFHRPYRKSLLRPSGMVLTKLDLSRHMLLDNAEQEDEQFVKRTVSRQSRLREGASSRTQNLDSASDGCQTEGPELEEHPEEERADGSEQWSDSEDYDTDLDVDATVTEMFQGQTQADQCYSDDDFDDDDEESPDVIRLKDYEKACKTEHAIPQSAILRNLGNRDIDLRHRNVGTKNLKPFFSALKENMRVQRLLLDENGLDEDGMESLANGLRDNVTISYLSVAGNPLGLKGLVHVVRLLLSNVTIQGLSLSDTKLGGDCIPLLSHLLKANKTLRFLDLSRNTFEEDQMRVMAAAVGENNSLEFLKLSWNNIRQSGAAAIAQSVTVNGKLRVLDLCWNGLGYPGAVAMAASLKENERLQELDISQNGINWEGAFIISKALVNNSTLKILRMGGNPVTTTGAMDLVEAASSPFCGLRLLDLTNVPVIFETEVLASSISQSRSFRLHHGGVVFIHDKIGRRLDRQRNPMERLLDHLRERMIRPLELLREFDKKNNGRITQAEFMSRLRKANVPLHGFEIRALAASVSDMKLDGTKQINYKKLVDGVEHHIIRDRMRKIRERAKKQRVRTYHTRILSASKPLYSNAQSYTSDTPSSLDMSHPGPPPSAMSLELDRMSRVSRTSKRSRSVVPMLAANDSTHSLVSPLTVKADERKPLLPQLRKTMSTFTLSAPLEEIGLKGKGKKTQKKNTKKQKKRRQSDPITRETTTLIAQAKET